MFPPKLVDVSHNTQPSVNLIPPAYVWRYWAKVAPLLEPATARTGGRMSLDTVYGGLCLGQYLLWLAHRDDDILAALVAEVRAYPTGLRTFVVLLLGGKDMDLWLDHQFTLEAWAREKGCTKMEMAGRKGWTRVLDWKETTVDMEKDLFDG